MSGFEFNKVYVLESLDSQKENLTGTELYKDLLRWKEFENELLSVELIPIHSKTELQKAFVKIKKECRTDHVIPILHFEMHGSKDRSGLVLESKELVEWLEIHEDLMDINTIAKNNVFITLAVCYGAYLLKTSHIHNRAPFWGIIGSFDTISTSDLMIRYNKFYQSFLNDFKLDQAIKILHESNQDIPSTYRYITSEQIFIKIYSKHFAESFTESAIKNRINDLLKENCRKINDKNEKARIYSKHKARLFSTKEQFFEEHKKKFFMIDLYPENEKRFKINFSDIERNS